MIRVCHVITGLAAHGAERMLLKLLSGLDRDRFPCAVISLMDQGAVGPDIAALGIPLRTLDLPRGRPTLAGLARLLGAVRALRPNLLQGWMYHGNLAATLAATLAAATVARGTPVLWNVRQSLGDLGDEKPLTRGLIHLSARLSGGARAIVYNAATSAAQHEALGFRRDRRVLIPNGFDVDTFRPAAPGDPPGLRADLGLDADALLIGMAAREHPMKDHASLLRAVGQLARERPEARLLLAGVGMEAGNARLGAAIAAAGLTGRVHLR